MQPSLGLGLRQAIAPQNALLPILFLIPFESSPDPTQDTDHDYRPCSALLALELLNGPVLLIQVMKMASSVRSHPVSRTLVQCL